MDIKRSSSITATDFGDDPPVVAMSNNCRVILVGAGKNLEMYSARSGAYLGGIASAHTGSR